MYDHYNCFTKEETAVQSGGSVGCVCVIIITMLYRRRNRGSEIIDLFNEQGSEQGLNQGLWTPTPRFFPWLPGPGEEGQSGPSG